MVEMGNAHSIFISKYEVKMQLGSSRYAGVGNMKIDVKEIGSEDVYCIHLVKEQDPVAGCYKQDNEPSRSSKDRNFLPI
jgi:hypothetical protein